MKTGYLIAGTALVLVSGIMIYNKIKKSAIPEQEPVEPTQGGGGNVPTYTPENPRVTELSLSGKKVDEVLKTAKQSSLVGKKVYAAYDDTNVYTYFLNPYTKAKKGQYLGTFSSAKPIQQGGFWVALSNASPDPSNKYVMVKDFFLKF